MALTALSNGVTLPTKFFELGIAGKIACAIVGIPSSRLSLCVSGVQDLSPRDAERLHSLHKMLTKLQMAVPFPLSFRDADRWRDIVKRIEQDNINIDDIGVAMDKIFGGLS
jgi:hypothetical protein